VSALSKGPLGVVDFSLVLVVNSGTKHRMLGLYCTVFLFLFSISFTTYTFVHFTCIHLSFLKFLNPCSMLAFSYIPYMSWLLYTTIEAGAKASSLFDS